MSAIGQAFQSQTDSNNQVTNAGAGNQAGYQALQGVKNLAASAQGNGAVQQGTQAALQAGTNQGIKEAAGTVASTKGVNPAMAARMAGQNAANSTQNAANAAAGLQAQNTLAAQGQYATAGSNLYGTAENAYNGVASNNSSVGQNAAGSAASAIGTAAMALNKGGAVQNYADGGVTEANPSAGVAPSQAVTNATKGPKSAAAQYLTQGSSSSPMVQGFANLGQGIGHALSGNGSNTPPASAGFDADENTPAPPGYNRTPNAAGGYDSFAKGGMVNALLSPGEKYLSPKDVQEVKNGKDPLVAGKKVPGKPEVKGAKDSLKNDKVPAKLEEGGIVLPRSVTQSKNPHWEAHKFVSNIMKQQSLKKK